MTLNMQSVNELTAKQREVLRLFVAPGDPAFDSRGVARRLGCSVQSARVRLHALTKLGYLCDHRSYGPEESDWTLTPEGDEECRKFFGADAFAG